MRNYIPKDTLYRGLNLSQESSASLRQRQTSEGPGKINFGALLQGEKEVFSVLEQAPQATKPAIIFSMLQLTHTYFDEDPTYDFALVRALIREGFKIYIWQGEGVPFRELSPITSSEMLWDQIDAKIYPQKASMVTKSLLEQGVDKSQFIVLDYMAYHNLFCRIDAELERFKLKQALDFNQDLKPTEASEYCVDLRSKSPIQFQDLMRNASAIEDVRSLIIEKIDHQELSWLFESFPRLDHLLVDEAVAGLASLKRYPSLRRLSLNGWWTKDLDFMVFNHLESLEIGPDGSAKIVAPGSLKKLSISAFSCVENWSELKNIESLKVHFCEYAEEDGSVWFFSIVQSLSKLKKVEVSLELASIPGFLECLPPGLESINIHVGSSNEEPESISLSNKRATFQCDFRSFSHLKEISLNISHGDLVIFLPRQLHSFSYHGLYSEYEIEAWPDNLKKLDLYIPYSLAGFPYRDTTPLEALGGLTTLEELSLDGHFFQEFQLPPNLVYFFFEGKKFVASPSLASLQHLKYFITSATIYEVQRLLLPPNISIFTCSSIDKQLGGNFTINLSFYPHLELFYSLAWNPSRQQIIFPKTIRALLSRSANTTFLAADNGTFEHLEFLFAEMYALNSDSIKSLTLRSLAVVSEVLLFADIRNQFPNLENFNFLQVESGSLADKRDLLDNLLLPPTLRQMSFASGSRIGASWEERYEWGKQFFTNLSNLTLLRIFCYEAKKNSFDPVIWGLNHLRELILRAPVCDFVAIDSCPKLQWLETQGCKEIRIDNSVVEPGKLLPRGIRGHIEQPPKQSEFDPQIEEDIFGLVRGINPEQFLPKIHNIQMAGDFMAEIHRGSEKKPEHPPQVQALAEKPKPKKSWIKMRGPKMPVPETQQRAFSSFSLVKNTRVSADTEMKGQEIQCTGGIVTAVYVNGKPVPANAQRIFVYDEIIFKGNKIQFRSSSKPESRQHYKIPGKVFSKAKFKDHVQSNVAFTAKNRSLGVTVITGEVPCRTWIPLPCQSIATELVELAQNKDCSILFQHDEKFRQFYFYIDNKAETLNLDFFVHYYQDLSYFNDPEKMLIHRTALLPQSVQDRIVHALRPSKLAFIFDQNTSREEKIYRLREFFRHFPENGPALKGELKDDLDVLLQICLQETGACEHRAKAMVLLGHFLQMPLILVENKVHAFVNIIDVNAEIFQIQLGGYDRKFLYDDAVQKAESQFQDISKPITQTVEETQFCLADARYGKVPDGVYNAFLVKNMNGRRSIFLSASSEDVLKKPQGAPLKFTHCAVLSLKNPLLGDSELISMNLPYEVLVSLPGLMQKLIVTHLEKLISAHHYDSRAKFNASQIHLDNEFGSRLHQLVALMAFFQYCHIPARLIVNESHSHLEILTQKWGGGPDWQDVESALTLEDYYKFSNPDLYAAKLEYEARLQEVMEVNRLTSAQALLEFSKKANPMVRISSKQSAFSVNSSIVKLLRAQGQDISTRHLFINSAKDFKIFFSSYRVGKKNDYQLKVEGPLQRLLRNGNAVIVINWSNCSHTQRALYKTLMDKERSLGGLLADKSLQVIGILDENIKASEPFLSRCVEVELEGEAFNAKPRAELPASLEKPDVNLYGLSYEWNEPILGDIFINSNTVQYLEGELPKAIGPEKSLSIANAPDNQELECILYRVQEEGGLWLNSEYLPVPESFSIALKTFKPTFRLSNIQIVQGPQENGRLFFLNLNTFHYYRSLFTVDPTTGEGSHSNLAPNYLHLIQEEDLIYATENLPEGYWHWLLSMMEEKYPEKTFRIAFAPNCQIPLPLQSIEAPQTCGSLVSPIYVSNDPDFLCRELLKEHVGALYVAGAKMHFYHHLIESERLLSVTESAIRFEYITQEIAKALMSGRDVILNMDLSPTLYQQLLPFLQVSPNKTVLLNGQWKSIPGQLIIVGPKASQYHLQPLAVEERDFTFEDYAQQDFSEGDRILVRKIRQFYELASKLPHNKSSMPSEVRMNYERLCHMLLLLKSEKNHKNNFLKSAFHYDYFPGSEEYAYLSVMAKVIFFSSHALAAQSQIARPKLLRALNRFQIQSVESAQPHLWTLLNSLENHQISQFLSAENPPKINAEKFLDYLLPHFGSPSSSKAVDLERQEKEIEDLILGKHSILFLKGPSGVGKSYTARQLLEKNEFQIFEGLDSLENYLKADGKRVLLLDEGNKLEPTALEVLKGISVDGKTWEYLGKSYPLDGKVIITGNQEHELGRFYHGVLQDHAYIYYLKAPSDAFLKAKFIDPVLPGDLQDPALIQAILAIYHSIAHHQHNKPTTIRDFTNLMSRFLLYCEKRGEDFDWRKALFLSAMKEFAYSLESPDKHTLFLENLAQILNADLNTLLPLPQGISEVKGFYVTDSRRMIWEAIVEDLALRKKAIEGEKIYYKKGILLIGESGEGKTTIFQKVLESQGIEYVTVTAGSLNSRELIREAFLNGKAIILDELNLDPEIEVELNGYMDGCFQGLKPLKEGFMVLSSKNPDEGDGLFVQASPLLNRFHVIHNPSFPHEEYVQMAGQSPHIAYPALFAQTFREVARRQGREAHENPRQFFEVIKRLQP